MTPDWNIDSAIELYNIDRWGTGYFSINPHGHVEILPTKNPAATIDIMEVIDDARDRGLTFPLVIRFQDLLQHRLRQFHQLHTSGIRTRRSL